VTKVTKSDLTNSVINACFLMLFKDLIRLLACYNDAIINLLGTMLPFIILKQLRSICYKSQCSYKSRKTGKSASA